MFATPWRGGRAVPTSPHRSHRLAAHDLYTDGRLHWAINACSLVTDETVEPYPAAISHAFPVSNTWSSLPSSLCTPRIMLRTPPRRVSGGLSKLESETSITSPISSTSRLTAPSRVRTTTFRGNAPSGR